MSETNGNGTGTWHDRPLTVDAAAYGEDVSAFLGSVRLTLERPVDELTARVRAAAIVAESRAMPERARHVTIRRRLVLTLAAMLAISALFTGLAYARVIFMPAPIRDVLSRIGIDLPEPASRAPHDPPATGTPSGPAPAADPEARPPSAVPSPAPTAGSTPGTGNRPDEPGGRGADAPGRPGGDRPGSPAPTCEFPHDVLGCDQDPAPPLPQAQESFGSRVE
ncbi:MAG TPA: hypothetical protein VGB64_05145 [Actinomycetota bacterium]